MSDPCLVDTDSIALTLVGAPAALQADVVPSADPRSGLVILPGDGVFAPGRPPIVSVLPGSPSDGDEILYLADATDNTLWHLRYVASEPAHKWICIGGSALCARRTQSGSVSPGGGDTWVDLSGSDIAGPSIVAPLAGAYDLEFGCMVNSSADGTLAQVGVSRLGDDPANNDTADNSTTRNISVTGFVTAAGFGAIAASATIRLMYRCGGTGGTASFDRRWLRLFPRKVG